ncbi:MAG: alpha/beta hydrolase [Myxococcota bacterium]
MKALGCRLNAAVCCRVHQRKRKSPAGDHYVEALGARVRVRDVGSGPLAVVFVPDPPNVLEHHEAAFEALARHVRVVGLELPGFGFSSAPSRFRFSVAENRDIVLAVLDALGVERAVLALSCVAGLASVAAAVRRPELVAGVVGVQTPDLPGALAWAARVDPNGLLRTPLIGQLAVRLRRRPLAGVWYRAATGDRSHIETLEREALRAYDNGAVYALASGLQSLSDIDPEALFGTLESLPAAAIWGGKDRTHRRTDRRGLARYLPRLEVREIEEAGHFPDLERPEAFQDQLLRWMDRSL